MIERSPLKLLAHTLAVEVKARCTKHPGRPDFVLILMDDDQTSVVSSRDGAAYKAMLDAAVCIDPVMKRKRQ